MAPKGKHAFRGACHGFRQDRFSSLKMWLRAALYLVSDDSAGITGIMHVVDGGLLAAAEFNVPL